MNRSVVIFWVLLFALALVQLGGCGFKKRGAADIPEQMSVTYIQGNRFGDVHRAVRNFYINNGAEVADDRNKASAVLRLMDVDFERQTLSVSERGKVLEIQLTYKVVFDVVAPDGKAMVDEQRIVLERSYLNPQTEVLGREREQEQLRKDMAENVAQQIGVRVYAALSGGL